MDVVSLAAEFPNDNPELHRGVSWVCLDVTGAPVAILSEPEPEPASMSAAELIVMSEPEPPPAALPDDPPIPEPRISGIVALGSIDHAALDLDLDLDLVLDLDLADDANTEILVEDLPPLDETAFLEGAAPVVAPVAAAPAAAAPAAAAPVETSTALPPAPDDPFTTFVSALAGVAIGAGSPYVASLLPALLLEGRVAHALPADAAQALDEADIVRANEVTATFAGQTRAWRSLLAGTSDDFTACGNAMLDEWSADLLARLLGAPARATALRRELRAHGVAAFGLIEAA